MISWYYNMLTKKQYIDFLCSLETGNKTRDHIIEWVTKQFVNVSLEEICKLFITMNKEIEYREHLKDYLNVKYWDLLDDELTISNNFTIDEILNKL